MLKCSSLENFEGFHIERSMCTHTGMCAQVDAHIRACYVYVYTRSFWILKKKNTGKEIVLFESLLFMPLKHAYANKEWHGSSPGSRPIL